MHDAGLKAHCDSVNRYLENELHKTKISLSASNSLAKEFETSRDLWKSTSETKDSLAVNVGKQNAIDLKLGKKRARKTGFFIGVGIWVAYEAVKLLKP